MGFDRIARVWTRGARQAGQEPDAPFFDPASPETQVRTRPSRPAISAAEEAESRRRWARAVRQQQHRDAFGSREMVAIGLYAAALLALETVERALQDPFAGHPAAGPEGPGGNTATAYPSPIAARLIDSLVHGHTLAAQGTGPDLPLGNMSEGGGGGGAAHRPVPSGSSTAFLAPLLPAAVEQPDGFWPSATEAQPGAAGPTGIALASGPRSLPGMDDMAVAPGATEEPRPTGTEAAAPASPSVVVAAAAGRDQAPAGPRPISARPDDDEAAPAAARHEEQPTPVQPLATAKPVIDPGILRPDHIASAHDAEDADGAWTLNLQDSGHRGSKTPERTPAPSLATKEEKPDEPAVSETTKSRQQDTLVLAGLEMPGKGPEDWDADSKGGESGGKGRSIADAVDGLLTSTGKSGRGEDSASGKHATQDHARRDDIGWDDIGWDDIGREDIGLSGSTGLGAARGQDDDGPKHGGTIGDLASDPAKPDAAGIDTAVADRREDAVQLAQGNTPTPDPDLATGLTEAGGRGQEGATVVSGPGHMDQKPAASSHGPEGDTPTAPVDLATNEPADKDAEDGTPATPVDLAAGKSGQTSPGMAEAAPASAAAPDERPDTDIAAEESQSTPRPTELAHNGNEKGNEKGSETEDPDDTAAAIQAALNWDARAKADAPANGEATWHEPAPGPEAATTFASEDEAVPPSLPHLLPEQPLIG
jgi:hypothetical protein